MVIFKENRCHAWADSTGERCKKKARWRSKYCWHHQSKIPIAMAFIIGIVTSLIIPKAWEHIFPSPTMQKIEKNTLPIPGMAQDIEIIKNEISPTIQATTIVSNQSENDYFITKVKLYSKRIIPNLYVAVYANTIFEFDVKPQREGVFTRIHPRKGDGFWLKNIPSFGGEYLLIVKTNKPEKIKIEYGTK